MVPVLWEYETVTEQKDLKKSFCDFYLMYLGALRRYPSREGNGKAVGFEARREAFPLLL
jgi:hypothetical protein